MSMEWRGKVVVDGAKAAAGDVAALRAELAAARGELARIGQAAPALGTIGQQAVVAKSPWEQLAGSMAKAKASLAGPAPKEPSWLAQAKGAEARAARGLERTKSFLAAAGAKLKGDTGAAGVAASSATGMMGAAGTALLAAAGVAGVASLTRLALGYRGVAQLQMLGARAQLQFRQLFSGVNPAPVVRAADRFLQMFAKTSVEGKALSGIFDRVFNGLFTGIEAAQPYASAFVDGIILGALKVENAWLRARIMLLPVTDALAAATGQTDGLAVAAQGASAAFEALAAVIDGIASGIKTIADLTGSLNTKVKRSYMPEEERIRLGNQDRDDAAQKERAEKASAATRQTYTRVNGKWQAEDAPQATPAASAPGAVPKGDARPAGKAIGKDFDDGLVQGIDGGVDAIAAAGGRAGRAAERGAREATETHSPSEKMRRVGRDLGAGEALGLDDSAGAIQAAAARSMVPTVPGAGAGGHAAGGGPSATVYQTFQITVGGGSRGDLERDVRAVATAVFAEQVRAFAKALGISVELVQT